MLYFFFNEERNKDFILQFLIDQPQNRFNLQIVYISQVRVRLRELLYSLSGIAGENKRISYSTYLYHL